MRAMRTSRLSGWCSGPGGDQCHVNRCLSPTCECPRRENHKHPEPTRLAPTDESTETPRESGATRPQSGEDAQPGVTLPASRFETREREDGLWEVIAPSTGQPARVQGQTTWTEKDDAERAARRRNRRLDRRPKRG